MTVDKCYTYISIMKDYMKIGEAAKYAKSLNMPITRQHIYWAIRHNILADHSHLIFGVVKLVKKDEFILFIQKLKKFKYD